MEIDRLMILRRLRKLIHLAWINSWLFGSEKHVLTQQRQHCQHQFRLKRLRKLIHLVCVATKQKGTRGRNHKKELVSGPPVEDDYELVLVYNSGGSVKCTRLLFYFCFRV